MSFGGWGSNNQSSQKDSDSSQAQQQQQQQINLFGSPTATSQPSVFGAFGQPQTFSSSRNTFGSSNEPSSIFGQQSTNPNTSFNIPGRLTSTSGESSIKRQDANVFGSSRFDSKRSAESSIRPSFGDVQHKSSLPSYSSQSASAFGLTNLSDSQPQPSSIFGQDLRSTFAASGFGQLSSSSMGSMQRNVSSIHQPPTQFVETIGTGQKQTSETHKEVITQRFLSTDQKITISNENLGRRKRSFDEDGASQNQSLTGSEGVELHKKRGQTLRSMLSGLQKHISPGRSEAVGNEFSKSLARHHATQLLSKSRRVPPAISEHASAPQPLPRARRVPPALSEQAKAIQPLSRTRRLSSGLSESAATLQSTAIICHDLPSVTNNREVLKNHFSQFGELSRITVNPDRNTATITFKTHEAAAAAKTGGAYISECNSPMKIFFLKKVRKSVEKSPRMPMKDTQKFNYPSTHKILARVKTQQGSSSRLPVKSKSFAPVYARNDDEKLVILEKIDTLLRKQVVRQFDIKKARTSIGTCTDMCPEIERYLRQQRKLLANYETTEGRVNHAKAVKEFSRSSADQDEPLPHDLRPAPVLLMTMKYLLLDMMPRLGEGQIADWYDFIWNRTRAIRKELTIQQISNVTAIHINEQCARFHIFCAHHLCEEDRMVFIPKMNNENLEKSMKTVMDLYNDIYFKSSAGCSAISLQDSNVTEMCGYNILLNINKTADVLNELQELPAEVRSSQDVGFAVEVFMAVHSNNYSKFFKAVRRATFLQGCILHRYFTQVRRRAASTIARSYTSKTGDKKVVSFPAEDFLRILHFNDIDELTIFCEHHGIVVNVNNNMLELNRNGLDEQDSSMLEKRSNQILSKIQQRSLAEIIAKSEIVLEDHKPYSSFDENGKYIGEHAALLSAESKPERFQALNQPTPQATEPTKSVPQIVLPQGVTGVDVKLIAKELFCEVIEVMSRTLAKETIDDTLCIVARNEVLEEHICDSGRCVAAEVIKEAFEEKERELAQRKALEEEKRRRELIEKEERTKRLQKELQIRLEKERLLKEEEDMKLQQTEIIATQLQSAIVDDMINEAASMTHHELLREHRIDIWSADELQTVTNDVVSGLLSEICNGVYVDLKKQQCRSIFLEIQTKKLERLFNKWSQLKTDKMKFQSIMRTFPNVPYSRQMGSQIKTLLPNQKPFSLARKRSSFPLDMNSEASLRSPMEVVRGRKRCKTYFDQTTHTLRKVYQEALQPLPFCELLSKATKSPSFDPTGVLSSGKSLLWKIALCLPVLPNEQKLLDWLTHAFLGNETDVCLCESDKKDAATKVKVCCCLISQKCARKDLMGASSIVFVLSPLTERSDPQYWANARARLEQLASSRPAIPTVPLLILLLDWQVDEEILDDLLGLPLLDFAFSRYSIISLHTGSAGLLENYKKLNAGVEFLFSQLPDFPVLSTATLREFFESSLSSEYIAPLYRHICQRHKVKMPPLEPTYQVEFYNFIIESIAGVANSEEFMEISWPPPEFSASENKLNMPQKDWNLEETLLYTYDNMLRCKVPTFPDYPSRMSESEILDIALRFANSVCTNCPALISAVRIIVETEIQKFNDVIDLMEEDAEDAFLDYSDNKTLSRMFDWHPIIDCIISQHLTNLLYHNKLGDLKVTFPSDALESIDKHPGFDTLFSETDFSTLNELPTATQTLNDKISILEEDSCVEINHSKSKRYATDVTWIKEENEVSKATRQTEKLCQEVKREQQVNAEYQQRLQALLLEGDVSLGILDSSAISATLLSTDLSLFF